ncbi:tRNA (adenosine(37)-N6)-threonylcarbamoyltransferase complex dimerization subunit type 1 TsaB [Nesterenkonia sp. NBAIMH1]|uniref:tRNA (adenosine(37)-N6)-threonylcarbamoyltransferase complex dimerization subunit type 1 TsaB n=1 Tax=Nesterenkonia sp. NBAIMH1 TaxID=2600320 RepID=UPI0011B416A7|nr:tRNA (adenosine(37)-N6)-threonylcarbamoyltransferase complex dimerization subunit type 1 TsaB [Nesterenkonia sp. NBAIMH1]
MLLLALDTSAGASAAITRDGETLAAWSTDAANAHAEVLAPAVQQLLKQEHLSGTDLDGIVVGVGPGPFTGLRVGLALAQSLAIGWRRPLHGVCSLDSLALRAVESDTVEGEFLVATDARRREVYWGRYENDDEGSRLLEGPFVGPAADLPDLPAVGAGVSLYPQHLRASGEGSDVWVPHAAELAALAEGALAGELMGVLCAPRPLYLRDSDAKVPAQLQRDSA